MVKSEIMLMSLVNKLSPFISCMMYYFNQVGEVTITKDDTLFLRGKGQEKAITDRVDSIRFGHSCIYNQFAFIIGKNKKSLIAWSANHRHFTDAFACSPAIFGSRSLSAEN